MVLQKWLSVCSVQVVNAFLFAMRSEHNQQPAEHVYVFPSYLAVMWDRHLFDRWMFSSVSAVTLPVAEDIISNVSVSEEHKRSVPVM